MPGYVVDLGLGHSICPICKKACGDGGRMGTNLDCGLFDVLWVLDVNTSLQIPAGE